jgi:hypothetical protein
MSFYVHFDVDQAMAGAFIAELNRRVQPASLAAFVHHTVGPFIRRRIDQRFLGEGDDVTGRWHPLTMATQMIRAQKGYPPDHPINRRTNLMHNFLVSDPGQTRISGPLIEFTHPQPTGDGLMNQKIETAQAGRRRPFTPARPVVGLNTNDMLFVTSELAAYLIA